MSSKGNKSNRYFLPRLGIPENHLGNQKKKKREGGKLGRGIGGKSREEGIKRNSISSWCVHKNAKKEGGGAKSEAKN